PLGFDRSLSIDDARTSGALVAYAMNGDALPLEHGRPVRLVFPGWYAGASVKWLTRIDVIGQPFEAYFQTDRYMYEWERDGGIVREPVRLQQVRALITEPADGATVPAGNVVVRGVAWSGAAAIDRVDVSVWGDAWQRARLLGERRRHSWQWWELLTHCDVRGACTIRARATDLAGPPPPRGAPPGQPRGGGGARASRD